MPPKSKSTTVATDLAAGDTSAALNRLTDLEDPALAGDPERFRHQKKLLKEASLRKKNAVVVSERVLIVSANAHKKKGRKVVLERVMKNGNKHRTWIGWEKYCKAYLEKVKREGKLQSA